MSLYYPQGAMVLRVLWEDFGSEDEKLQETYRLPILARNVTVEINDYREADTFKCEIDYKSFPFDPRCIRACGVSIHIEDKKSIYKGNSLNILKPTEANTVFMGFADEETISFDDDTRVVRLEGRDFTSIFLDAAYLGKPVSLARPVDKIIEGLIWHDNIEKQTKAIKIINRTGAELPVLSKFAPDLESSTAVENAGKKSSYWEMIQKVISRAGLIGYMELDKFIISKPQLLYKNSSKKIFIYGKNVKSLNYKRKLGRRKGFNIEVRSVFPEKKSLGMIIAKIPKDVESLGFENTIPQLDKEGKKIKPEKAAPYIKFNVTDISSKQALIDKGLEIYEELSRQEIEGSLSTFEMEIPEEKDGRTKPVSFNTLRNGTPIEIQIEQDDLEMIRSVSSKRERKKFLIRQGYEPNVAEAFADSMDKAKNLFYTKSVRFELDQDQGFEMNIDFINFVEIKK